MSCGDPHDEDCREVLDEVWTYLDKEVTRMDVERIKHHLAECAPCLRQYDLEEALIPAITESPTSRSVVVCASGAPPGDTTSPVTATSAAITTRRSNPTARKLPTTGRQSRRWIARLSRRRWMLRYARSPESSRTPTGAWPLRRSSSNTRIAFGTPLSSVLIVSTSSRQSSG